MTRSRNSFRNSNKFHPLLEQLECRAVPAAFSSFGFVTEDVNGDGNADDLLFHVTGTSFNDVMTASTLANGDFQFRVQWNDGEEDFEDAGTVSAGDIALAELITGTKFRGFQLNGDGGNDMINASEITNRSVELNGDKGDDVLIGGRRADVLNGGLGDDILDGRRGADELHGGDGDDELTGGRGRDQLFGESGNDTLIGDHRDIIVSGGRGGEVAGEGETAGGDVFFADKATTTAGIELINSDIEVVHGSEFDDFIDSSSYVSAAGAGVEVNGMNGNDSIIGSNANDILRGGSANSSPGVFDGDDAFEGLGGADIIDGGTGSDLASYFASPLSGVVAGVTINLSTGVADGGHATGDKLMNIENLLGSAGNDSLTGDDTANILLGSAGDDVLNGLGGDDSLAGEAGDDTLLGRQGNDLLLGGDGDDVLNGNAGDDTLHGEAGRDKLRGGGGADVLVIDANELVSQEAGVQPDFELFGGAGSDTFAVINATTEEGGIDPVKLNAVLAYLNALVAAGDADYNGAKDLLQFIV